MEKVVSTRIEVGKPTEKFNMWTFRVGFEDGFIGIAYAKSENPPYQVGDTVEVLENGTVAGGPDIGKPKLKIKRLEGNGGQGMPSQSNALNSGAQAPLRASSGYNGDGARQGMIVNNIIQLFIAGKGNINECHNIAMQAVNLVEGRSGRATNVKGGGHGEDRNLAYDPSEEQDAPF